MPSGVGETAWIDSLNLVVFDASFAISTCLLPLMLYLILYKSKSIGKYRWYMLNNIIWDYLYDVLVAFLKVRRKANLGIIVKDAQFPKNHFLTRF